MKLILLEQQSNNKDMKIFNIGSKKKRSVGKNMFQSKHIIFLMSFFLLNLSTVVYSQNKTLSLNVRNKPIKEILIQIQEQTDYRFIYESQTTNFDKRVSLNVTNEPVEEVLKKLFEKEGIKYSITENNLILINPSVQSNSNTRNEPGQGINISGKIKDSTGEYLPGASIHVKGSTIGIISDLDGNYNITVPNRNAVLVFSYIGYVTQEIVIGNNMVINVTMHEDTQLVDEIVVVGYGVQKKASAVGAITAIKGEKLTSAPVVNLSAGLAGQAPGLYAITRTGEPGNDGATLRIRGQNTIENDNDNNSPLIVIDGISNRHGGLDRIDANDVESISILKDASAAIYGAQAANGVILVTTKRGKTGKPKVTYSYNQGFAQATRLPKMADAATYATMMNELAQYGGNQAVYTSEEIQKFRDGSDPLLYPNTDWFAETMKTLSPQYKQNLAINGGTESFQYYVSLGSLGQDGFYKNSGTRYDQYNLRSNFNVKFNEYISVGVDLNAREQKKEGLTQANYYEVLMIAKPTAIAFWPNGLPGPAVQGNTNPAIAASKEAGYNRTKDYFVQSDFRLELQNPWIKGLKFVGNFAYDKQFAFYKEFRKNLTTYNWDKKSYNENGDPVLVPYTRPLDQSNPDLQQSSNDIYNMVINGTLQYNKTFNEKHNMNVLVGWEGNKGSNSYFKAHRKYYISDAIDELFAGGDRDKDNTGETTEYARLNYFGRFNYAYNNKYLFEFVGRYDGSYIFPAGKRYGFFPGFLVGWVASEEAFWKKNLPVFNYFKLRASWGQTGNDRVDAYQFLSSFSYSSENQIFGQTEEVKALYSSRVGNPNITWEVANQSNIAFEAQMFDGKLAFGMDFFYNKRTKILVKRELSVPQFTGINLPDENIGEVENKGIDFDITYRGNVGGLRYSIMANGGYAKNKIVYWDESPGILPHQRKTGYPIGTELYYKAIGIYKNQAEIDAGPHWPGARPGDVIFEDVKKDDKIDASDMIRSDKNQIPRFTGSFGVSLNYKDFDFTMMFQGAAGAVTYVKTFSGQIGNYLEEQAINRWTEDNPNSKYPRAFNRDEEYWRSQQNTFFLKSTDYIRLKNIELGYSLPQSFLSKLRVQNLRIYVSGFNLLTFDKLKVFDPEGEKATGQFYPQQKVYNVGASITF